MEETLATLRGQLLPSDLNVTITRNYGETAKQKSDELLEHLLLATLSVTLLIALALGWRESGVVLVAIPVTLALTLAIFHFFGYTLNRVTLFALIFSIGILVDDAIVVVEDIERHRDLGDPDPSSTSLRELLPALIASSLSTVIIFAPFALLPGITGAFFKPLALTMALALLVSFFIAVVAAPVAIAALERPGHRGEAEPIGGRIGAWRAGLNHAFDRGVGVFVDRGVVAVATLLLLLGGGWLLYRTIGTDFLPTMDEGSIILDYWTPPGTSLTDTNAMLDQVEKTILSLPDVASYSRRTGTQLGFFAMTEANTGSDVASMKTHAIDRGDRNRVVAAKGLDDVLDRLNRAIKVYLTALDPAALDDFERWLHEGPPRAGVEGVARTDLDRAPRYADFTQCAEDPE